MSLSVPVALCLFLCLPVAWIPESLRQLLSGSPFLCLFRGPFASLCSPLLPPLRPVPCVGSPGARVCPSALSLRAPGLLLHLPAPSPRAEELTLPTLAPGPARDVPSARASAACARARGRREGGNRPFRGRGSRWGGSGVELGQESTGCIRAASGPGRAAPPPRGRDCVTAEVTEVGHARLGNHPASVCGGRGAFAPRCPVTHCHCFLSHDPWLK